MSTLTFYPSYPQWSSGVSINYEIEYDADNNQSVVTFSECQIWYTGRSGYGSSAKVNIELTTNDTKETKSTQISTYGPTQGNNSVTFKATPSPVSYVLNHNNNEGEKTVQIKATAEIKVYPYTYSTGQATITGTGSVVENIVSLYKLTIEADQNSNAVVSRSFSNFVTTGQINSGATIYNGDVLQITFLADSGYDIEKSLVNNSAFNSGNSLTVSNNVLVVVTSKIKALAYVYNGNVWQSYMIYIYNGSIWESYLPFIYDGSAWKQLV